MKTGYKTYLGDGVYANFDGYHIVLTTENGFETTNSIYLEPGVSHNFIKYRDELIKKLNEEVEKYGRYGIENELNH